MQKWWMLYKDRLPNVNDSEKEYIEDITGRTPLLLCALLKLGGQDFKDVKSKFLASPELEKVPIQVEKHALQMRTILDNYNWRW